MERNEKDSPIYSKSEELYMHTVFRKKHLLLIFLHNSLKFSFKLVTFF